LARLIDDWRNLHLVNRREGYAVEAVRSIRRAFANYLDWPAADIDRALVVKVFDGMARDGSATAATHAAAYSKAAYGWAVKRGTLAANPFVNLPVAPIAKRDRVLSDDELLAIWRATSEPSSFNGIVRALILTGQRRDEVAGMGWAELADDLSTWTIPGSRAKNGVASIVPLATPVRDFLRAYPREGELVFSGRPGAFNGWSRAKRDLDARSGVKDWRLHDLRRTVATGLQRLGVRLEVTEAILNHVAGSRAGIVGLYQRHDYAPEKEAALAAWAAHLFALVEGRADGSNVVSIGKAAR
jgi:integrase